MTFDELLPYRNILLLQGPMGDFFTRFGFFLRRRGHTVFKINLNGGDLLFYPGPRAFSFRSHASDWPDYLKQFIVDHEIDAICMFGDCTAYHSAAVECARSNKVPVFVFEQGYIRPNFITFEKSGVNAYSRMPRNRAFYDQIPLEPESEPEPVCPKFWWTAVVAVLYQLASLFLRWNYPHYRYHKEFSYISEPYYWLRSFARQALYRYIERNVQNYVQRFLRKRYFLVPLQVHNDSQISVHSTYESVEQFIEEVIVSFARHATPRHRLIFKHHPVDRGYTDYARYIAHVAGRVGMAHRVLYVHDVHLPTLLRNALGTIVINSTVGISSLLHNTPVKVMGNAMYDFPGLTNQKSLDMFWKYPGRVNQELNMRFRKHIIEHTQINGHFFGRSPFIEDIENALVFEERGNIHEA